MATTIRGVVEVAAQMLHTTPVASCYKLIENSLNTCSVLVSHHKFQVEMPSFHMLAIGDVCASAELIQLTPHCADGLV